VKGAWPGEKLGNEAAKGRPLGRRKMPGEKKSYWFHAKYRETSGEEWGSSRDGLSGNYKQRRQRLMTRKGGEKLHEGKKKERL